MIKFLNNQKYFNTIHKSICFQYRFPILLKATPCYSIQFLFEPEQVFPIIKFDPQIDFIVEIHLGYRVNFISKRTDH